MALMKKDILTIRYPGINCACFADTGFSQTSVGITYFNP